MPTLDSTGLSFDSSLALTGGADLCTFDSTGTTFDSTLRTFDATTCQEVTTTSPPVSVSGGGDSRRLRAKRRVRLRYRSAEQEVIEAVAAEQVAQPTPEPERLEHLARALGTPLKAEHVQALDAERARLIGLEVKKYLHELMEREDEALLMALAEVV